MILLWEASVPEENKFILTVDHFVPLARSGPHEYLNIVPSCVRCNSIKGDGYIEDLIIHLQSVEGYIFSKPIGMLTREDSIPKMERAQVKITKGRDDGSA